MNNLKNVTTLWLLMMALTISTYMLGTLGYSGTIVVMFLLLTVLIKSTFIIRDFMELRGVSTLWKAIMYGWLGVVTSGIAIAYIAST
jgi:cytochrome c oxidase subunit 4